MPNRKYYLAALLLISASAVAQDKTLTFDNASPAKSVHLLNGTSVSIGTTGNLIAKCVLNGTTGTCADIGSGTGGGGSGGPSASIAAGSFSNAPNGSGAYPQNTQFTITPTVSNATVCWRHQTAGPALSAWSAAITSGFNTAVTNVVLSTASSSYTFRLECFNSSGGVTSNEITVATSTGTVEPPPDTACTDWTPTLEPLGFVRASIPSTWQQLQGANFPGSNLFSSLVQVPKATGAGLAFLGASSNTYAAVQFTTPASGSGSMAWQDSQIPGTFTTTLGAYYITISKCPGDFRYGAIASPANSTEYQACKSIRKTSGGSRIDTEGMTWNTSGVSGNGFTNNVCGLNPNETYYLNYANVDPTDGFNQQEHQCPNNVATCGVQFKASN